MNRDFLYIAQNPFEAYRVVAQAARIHRLAHQHLARYAKHYVHAEIPSPAREPEFIRIKTARAIGKAMITHYQHSVRQNNTTNAEITRVLGADSDTFDIRRFWNLRYLFLQGGEIEIIGSLTDQEDTYELDPGGYMLICETDPRRLSNLRREALRALAS